MKNAASGVTRRLTNPAARAHWLVIVGVGLVMAFMGAWTISNSNAWLDFKYDRTLNQIRKFVSYARRGVDRDEAALPKKEACRRAIADAVWTATANAPFYYRKRTDNAKVKELAE